MSDAMLIDRPDTEAAPVATRPDCPTIRRSLIALERFVDRDGIDLRVVDELARAFHWVKGLSALASIREAEETAEAMECVLGSLGQTGAGR